MGASGRRSKLLTPAPQHPGALYLDSPRDWGVGYAPTAQLVLTPGAYAAR